MLLRHRVREPFEVGVDDDPDQFPKVNFCLQSRVGRDPIVTRILWLRKREAQNRNAYDRYIYIHGTAEERTIGTPASYGCIRMRSRDVVQLHDVVGYGARVSVVNGPLAAMVPALAPQAQVATAAPTAQPADAAAAR